MFDTLDEMWLDAAGQLMNAEGSAVPSRDGGVAREVLGYCGRLVNPRACFLFNPVRKLSASYAAAELLWYLSGTHDATMMRAYAPQYERFCDPDGTAFGAYGGRWAEDVQFRAAKAQAGELPNKSEFRHFYGEANKPLSQLEALIWLLSDKMTSRQAVMTCWNAGDLIHAIVGDKRDLPCTLSLQFHVREGKLNLIVTMRSSDVWLGMPYDVWCFCCIQQLVADALNLDVGWYQQQAGSLHVYERNWEKLQSAAVVESFKTGELIYPAPLNKFNDDVIHALKLEQFIRETKSGTGIFDPLREHSLLGQVVLMAATKWDNKVVDNRRLDNLLLHRYLGGE